MNTLTADVRSASRALATARGFTAIAVTTRAAGIALSAVVLTVLNAYVVRGLPYPDPGIVMRSLHALRQRRGRNPACTHFHDNSTPHSTAKPTARLRRARKIIFLDLAVTNGAALVGLGSCSWLSA